MCTHIHTHTNTVMKYDKILYALHTCGLFTTMWPIDSRAGKFKTFFYNVLWFIYILNMINQHYMIITSLLLIYQEDFLKTMKLLLELIFAMEILFNLLYSKMQRKRLQVNYLFNLILLFYPFIYSKTPLEIKREYF